MIEKTESRLVERINIVITYEGEDCASRTAKRTMEVFEEDMEGNRKLLFSETETRGWKMGRTHSGIAGAVNLLHSLLYENEGAYYLNDEYELLKEVAEHTRCGGTDCRKNCRCVGEHCNLFWKLRFKLLQLKVKFFNVFK